MIIHKKKYLRFLILLFLFFISINSLIFASEIRLKQLFIDNNITDVHKKEDLLTLADILLKIQFPDEKILSQDQQRHLILSDLRNKIIRTGKNLSDLGTADSYFKAAKIYFGNQLTVDIEDQLKMGIRTQLNHVRNGVLSPPSASATLLGSGSNNIINSTNYLEVEQRRIAAADPDGLVSQQAGLDGILETIGNVVKFLAYFGFVAVTLAILWAGTLLVVSGGNTSAKEKAKTILHKALIGLFFIAAAYAIVAFITNIFIDRDGIADSPLLDLIETNEMLE